MSNKDDYQDMSREEILETLVRVELPNAGTSESKDDFLKIRETLSRMGLRTGKNKLSQSCHILHKKGTYYIVHFKELFALDGRHVNMTDEDFARRNTIARLLRDWELCTIVNENVTESPILPAKSKSCLYILPYSLKSEWELETKYDIGVKKNG